MAATVTLGFQRSGFDMGRDGSGLVLNLTARAAPRSASCKLARDIPKTQAVRGRRRASAGQEGARSMLIGIPLETTAGETRVAVTPETAKKLKAQGHQLRLQSNAGLMASAP